MADQITIDDIEGEPAAPTKPTEPEPKPAARKPRKTRTPRAKKPEPEPVTPTSPADLEPVIRAVVAGAAEAAGRVVPTGQDVDQAIRSCAESGAVVLAKYGGSVPPELALLLSAGMLGLAIYRAPKRVEPRTEPQAD